MKPSLLFTAPTKLALAFSKDALKRGVQALGKLRWQSAERLRAIISFHGSRVMRSLTVRLLRTGCIR
jgi:hypothetical protein